MSSNVLAKSAAGASIAAMALLGFAAFADPPHQHSSPGHGPGPAHAPTYSHGGGRPSYAHIPPPPYLGERWHGGSWHHGDHGHHDGWWWVVGSSWFWYPEPVYPYPDFYVPPGIVAAIPPGPPPAQYWYYCSQPPGYYPYITQCSVQWTAVTATPPPSPLPPGY